VFSRVIATGAAMLFPALGFWGDSYARTEEVAANDFISYV